MIKFRHTKFIFGLITAALVLQTAAPAHAAGKKKEPSLWEAIPEPVVTEDRRNVLLPSAGVQYALSAKKVSLRDVEDNLYNRGLVEEKKTQVQNPNTVAAVPEAQIQAAPGAEPAQTITQAPVQQEPERAILETSLTPVQWKEAQLVRDAGDTIENVDASTATVLSTGAVTVVSTTSAAVASAQPAAVQAVPAEGTVPADGTVPAAEDPDLANRNLWESIPVETAAETTEEVQAGDDQAAVLAELAEFMVDPETLGNDDSEEQPAPAAADEELIDTLTGILEESEGGVSSNDGGVSSNEDAAADGEDVTSADEDAAAAGEDTASTEESGVSSNDGGISLNNQAAEEEAASGEEAEAEAPAEGEASAETEGTEETEDDSAAEEAQESEEAAPAEEEAPAQPEEPKENLVYSTASNYVNVRASGSQDAEIIGKLYAGSVGKVIEPADENGWIKITSGSVTGYVSESVVATGDIALELASEVAHTKGVVKATLRVRAAPTIESDVISLIGMGQQLDILEDMGGWYRVDSDGGEGYISADFTDTETYYPEAVSIEAERREAEEKEAERRAQEQQNAASQSSSQTSSQPAASQTASSLGQQVVNYATQFLGNPYVWGGTSLTNGTDCSGFTMSVYSHFGVSLPHYDASQRSCGIAINSLAEAMPGDLICYYGHVGIYMGNGQIVHASNPRTGITIGSATYRQIAAIRRIFY